MLEQHHDYVAIRFVKGLSTRQKERVADHCHLSPHCDRETLPRERYSVHRVAPTDSPRAERHQRAMSALDLHEHVARVAPVMQLGRQRIVTTDRIHVAFSSGGARTLEAIESRGGRILKSSEGEHLVRLPEGDDPLTECRRLERLASVEYAEPDFVIMGRHIPSALGRKTKLARAQYAMKVTKTREAWRKQAGDPAVVIAVIDGGVLANHEDLSDALLPEHDATRHQTAKSPLPWDSHGTSCAGLVAGANTPAGGVKGVGAGCRMVSVRVGCTPSRFDSYVTKVSWVAQGIDWAWKNGVSVLNMSFGGGPPSKAIERALKRARTRGRDGKGCVLVAAVGNGGEAAVEFPASVKHVIGVAATDENDEPADFSNYGPEVDVAAPGVDCYTSTVPDPGMDEPDLYTTLFSGTSAAAPVVSGLAGLVLSANPDLSEKQVRHLIGRTADPVGKKQRYHDGRNDHMGRGRVNTLGAVDAARARLDGDSGQA